MDNDKYIMVRNLVIEFRQNHKRIQAVKNVSFDIRRGEIFSLVGESGSGKTTISRAIAGIQKVSNGTIYMNQRLLQGSPPQLQKINRKFNVNCKHIFKNQNQIRMKINRLIRAFGSLQANNLTTIMIKEVNNDLILLMQLVQANISFLKLNLEINYEINEFVNGLHAIVKEITIDYETAIITEIKKSSDILTKSVNFTSKIYRDLKLINENFVKWDNNKDDINIITLLLEKTSKVVASIKLLEPVLQQLSQHQKIVSLLFLHSTARKHTFLKLFVPYYLKLTTLKRFLAQEQEKTKNDDYKLLVAAAASPSSFSHTIISRFKNKHEIIIAPKIVGKYQKLKALKTNKIYSDSEVLRFFSWLKWPTIDLVIKKAPFFAKLTKPEKKAKKKEIQMIFQDPYASLNDRISVAEIIAEGLNAFPEIYQNETIKKMYLADQKIALSKQDAVNIKKQDLKAFLIAKIVQEVGLLPEHLSRYSYDFSGGQRQRIGIARALVMNPQLVIADEPISALDVSIRAQILNLLKRLQEKYQLTFLFVAHDLTIVNLISDRIAVLYQGKIVELAPAQELFNNPLHPYTKSLLSAILVPNPVIEKTKKHLVYDPIQEHYDYHYDLPEWVAITKEHYIYANNREIDAIKATKINRKEFNNEKEINVNTTSI